MKSVLMVAYHFPPEGNAGAYRPLRFVRHLPCEGWQPIVITLDAESYERYDPSLLNQVPDNIRVIRVRNRDPWQAFQARRRERIQKQLTKGSTERITSILPAPQSPMRSRARELIRSFEAWIYHPDITMGWIAPAVKAIERLCKRKCPDAIWATAGPVSSFYVAERASRITGVPYVLDFRDAWTIIPTEFDRRRPAWVRRFDRRKMFRLLKEAQAVIFRYNTEAECFWRVYQGALDSSRIYIIPNGYEGAIEEFNPRKGDKCKILYTGTLPDYRYDTLLQAMCYLKQSSPDLANQLDFQFVGEGTQALHDDAARLGIAEMVTTCSAISHDNLKRLYQSADALLVLGRPQTMKGYELFAPAKLFGYLNAGRPIIGVLPPDEAKKILHRLGATTVADIDSVGEIVELLRKLLHAWTEGKLSLLNPNITACKIYAAEHQTRTLVCALEGSPASDPFIPGLAEIPGSLREEIYLREEEMTREASVNPQKTLRCGQSDSSSIIRSIDA